MSPARATRLTLASLNRAIREGKVLFMNLGHTIESLGDGFKVVDHPEGLPFHCSVGNKQRAVSPDGKFLFTPFKARKKE